MIRTLLLCVLVGCEPIPTNPAGPLAPVSVAPAVTTAAEQVAPTDGYDFQSEDPDASPAEATDTNGADELSPLELQARMMGLDVPPPVTPAAAAVTNLAPAVAPPSAPSAAPPSWDPNLPAAGVDGVFGVRLLSTVPEAQPPMAVLGLASGKERVIHPGDLLPGPGLVVMAIGRDAVQIATITAKGDHATVRTEVLRAMYPGQLTPQP